MCIQELADKINGHYGEVWCFTARPANTYKDGKPIDTQIELHIGHELTIILDDTSESSWYVKDA